MGRVVQDVVTRPVRKWARLQGKKGFVEWVCGYRARQGRREIFRADGEVAVETFAKTRPDDFILELRHIAAAMEGDTASSPLAIERGLDTMMVVAASHHSAQARRRLRSIGTKGYSDRALKVR